MGARTSTPSGWPPPRRRWRSGGGRGARPGRLGSATRCGGAPTCGPTARRRGSTWWWATHRSRTSWARHGPGGRRRRDLRRRFGTAVRAYTDTAWLFLLLGCQAARPGGRVVMVQPQSLAARVTPPRCGPRSRPWPPRRPVGRRPPGLRGVGAGLRPGAPPPRAPGHPSADGGGAGNRAVARPAGRRHRGACPPRSRAAAGSATGRRPSPASATSTTALPPSCGRRRRPSWRAPRALAPGHHGLAARRGSRARGSRARGEEAGRPLITVGAIDWAGTAWGCRAVRFAKQRWEAPTVDAERLARDATPAAAPGPPARPAPSCWSPPRPGWSSWPSTRAGGGCPRSP